MRKETDIMSDRDYFDDSHPRPRMPKDRAELERIEKEAVEAYNAKVEREAEEFIKRYNEQKRDNAQKKRKKTKKLWSERHSLFQAIAYIIAIGWHGYTLRIIAISDIDLFLKIIMIIGGLVLALFTCISLHDDE